MKNFGILILGLSVFVGMGCGRSKRVAEPEIDGAAISEIGEVSPVAEEEPKKKKKLRWGKRREAEQEIAEAGEEAIVEDEAPQPKDKQDGFGGDWDQAAKALSAAKLHIELGDYDLAGEELRKIGEGSPLYGEALRLLEAYR